jgi:hypothetical protein
MSRIASIIGKFPERELGIRRLCSQDSGFREVCEDYDEAVAELGRACLANHEKRAEDFRRLLAELETEILENLDKRAVPVRGRAE